MEKIGVDKVEPVFDGGTVIFDCEPRLGRIFELPSNYEVRLADGTVLYLVAVYQSSLEKKDA